MKKNSCKICQHENAEQINAALKAGAKVRPTAETYGVNYKTLGRHAKKCLGIERPQGRPPENQDIIPADPKERRELALNINKVAENLLDIDQKADKLFEKTGKADVKLAALHTRLAVQKMAFEMALKKKELEKPAPGQAGNQNKSEDDSDDILAEFEDVLE